MNRWLCLLALLAASGAVADPDFTTDDVMKHIKYLASDELGGRLAVSPEFVKASEYCAGQFKKYGLQPKGADGYFQPFEMTAGLKVGKNNFLYAMRGGKRIDFELERDYAPMPGGVHNKWFGGNLAFAGYGIQSADRNDYAGIDPRGKVVMFLRDQPATGGATLAVRLQTAYSNGAAGVILVSADVRQPDAVGLGSTRVRSDVKIPVMQMTRAAAEKLLGKSVSLAADGKAFDVPNTSIKLITDVRPNAGFSRNVIGFLPGNDPALRDQIIVIGGHLDHIGHGDVGAMDRNNEIHNGADDNASGSAGVMELAEYYAATKKNRRSILFMLFGGEEEGLIGSFYFVKNPTVDLSKVTAMLNFDMIGRLKDNKLTVEGVVSSPLWPEWIDAQNTEGLAVTKKPDATGASDHTGFFTAGIPVVFFFTNDHEDYHRSTDDWQKINYEGEVKVLRYARRMIDAIDSYDAKIPYQKTVTKTETTPPPTGAGRGGSKVRIGLQPDYTYSGPGVMLTGVSEGTPADKAGLKSGDIILAWNGKTVDTLEEMMEFFVTAKAGEAVKLTVQRGSEKKEITVIPEEAE